MTAEIKLSDSPLSKPGMSLWLACGTWGLGGFIYGWLFAGVRYGRDYWNFAFESLGWADWSFAAVCGLGSFALILIRGLSAGKQKNKNESNQLIRIVSAVLPAFFLISSLAVLALTFTTYDPDWQDARQGIATAFAALIAAVGVVVSVAVTYKTGEENRLAQKEIEQQKLDAEIIKTLHERLHEVIPRRYGKDSADEVSASFFQLASLYKDWETLAATSSLVDAQKDSQQRNILKILFGIHKSQEINDGGGDTPRSELEIRTLNSIIQNIFPKYLVGYENSFIFDLSYLDLSYLDFSSRDMRGSNFKGAFIKNGKFENARLEGAFLTDSILNDSVFENSYLNDAHLDGANLDNVEFKEVHLEGANLYKASMVGTDFNWTYLEGATLFSTMEMAVINLSRSQGEVTLWPHDRVIRQLASCKSLPLCSELRKILYMTDKLVNQVQDSHRTRGREIPK